MRADDATALAPYQPGLVRAARAMAAVAILTEAVELGVGPHRVLSAVFLGVGLLAGVVVGRNLGRALRAWADDAPPVDADESGRVVPPQPSTYATVALAATGLIGLLVPVIYHIPTPIPGALAAGAVQTLIQSRFLNATEQRRRGLILRPSGRFSFDGSELRLLPDVGPANSEAEGPG